MKLSMRGGWCREEILWNQACFGPFKTMNYAYKTLMKSSAGQNNWTKTTKFTSSNTQRAKTFASFWRTSMAAIQITFALPQQEDLKSARLRFSELEGILS